MVRSKNVKIENKKARIAAGFLSGVVEPRGIEPLTSAMPLQRSPS